MLCIFAESWILNFYNLSKLVHSFLYPATDFLVLFLQMKFSLIVYYYLIPFLFLHCIFHTFKTLDDWNWKNFTSFSHLTSIKLNYFLFFMLCMHLSHEMRSWKSKKQFFFILVSNVLVWCMCNNIFVSVIIVISIIFFIFLLFSIVFLFF